MIFLAVHNGQPKNLRSTPPSALLITARRSSAAAPHSPLQSPRPRTHPHRYQIALDHLDNVIKIIRQSSSPPTPRNLFQYFSAKNISLRAPNSAA